MERKLVYIFFIGVFNVLSEMIPDNTLKNTYEKNAE